MSADSKISRRDFLLRTAITSGALQAWPALNLFAAASMPILPPVVAFHMDQPYVDHSGKGIPYLPPAGARSAQPLSNCDAEYLRRHYCYSI